MENYRVVFPYVSENFRVFHQIHRPYYHYHHLDYEFNTRFAPLWGQTGERMHT